MQTPLKPLRVIIDPPDIQSGMPGDTLELHVTVINQSNQGAVIDVFFNEISQTLHHWCKSPRERLALGPQQSSEVTFQFQISFEAFAGTYNYTLVVDAPEHYPEETPIRYPRQIKVLLKEQTVARVNDPTFFLSPATNPSSLATLKPGEPLQVVVTVDNRSDRVDRFRLTCLDLEEDWFTIRYLATGLEGPGVVSEPSGLELNPAAQGQILLQFHPPADTLAGSYSPTVRLHSSNSPDLVLLDLVYIQIPAVYHLDIELITILGKVSRSSGQYEIKLANRGNTLRNLVVSAKSRDEEELCTYQCESPKVRILPSKSIGGNLTVKPVRWWRQPLIGAGLVLNFIVEIQDRQALPLPEKLPQGTLVWKPRPWWQFLLLVLAALGLLGGIAFIIWLLFLKPPNSPELVNFTADSPNYVEGNVVRLSWQIRNFKQLSKLELSSEGPVPSLPEPFDFSQGIPDKLKSVCQAQEQMLTCTNFNTDARKPGDYTFTLSAFPDRQGVLVAPKILKVKIAEKPAAEVASFRLDKDKYTKGELMRLDWQVQNREQLSQLKIVGKTESGVEPVASYNFTQGSIPDELSKLCKSKSRVLTCTKVPVAAPKAGRYTFELQAFSKPGKPPKSKPAETQVEVLPEPIKIVRFTLNGSEEPNRVLKNGQPVILNWQVKGGEIDVELSPFGSVGPLGSQKLIANQALPARIEIIVTDKLGRSAKKGFSVKVETPLPFQIPPLAPPPSSQVPRSKITPPLPSF